MTRLVDFSKFTSVRIGGVHEIFEVDNLKDLSSPHFLGSVMIGGGNNLLISPNPPKMAMLGKSFDYINLERLGDKIYLEIGAATKSAKIYNFSKQNNIAGLEFLKNIPGTLGGLIKMNAGLLKFSISDNLTHVCLARGWVGKDEINFSYRHSGIDETILGAKFKLHSGFDASISEAISAKRANQPKGASFGSCFVNPEGHFAGALLEAVGLKGYAIGGAKFSEEHANFLINFNHASFEDATSLINLAKARVLEKFGVELKTEVCIL
ncbi:UDP-N-acetylmuramate dehydrogenase [Campylobacter concisus]|uniref:UDP-N-acetylmuramate dehydrogenase n=1 Tax=Campylobacter concisus TaxID=199 RepID=UPI000CD8BAC3|nr:UDP-N-acetylmuramate dehydrogenase [Campylobacter concisus]